MTSNTIESLNSQISKYAGKVTRWSSSNMRGRWIAVSLMQIEKRLNRIVGHDKLNLLRIAIKDELKLEQIRVA
jgi:translation initiation factor IF-1